MGSLFRERTLPTYMSKRSLYIVKKINIHFILYIYKHIAKLAISIRTLKDSISRARESIELCAAYVLYSRMQMTQHTTLW